MNSLIKKDLPKWNFCKNNNTLAKNEQKSSVRMLQSLSDEKLVRLFQKGDNLAFRIILDRHHKPVFNFLQRNLGNFESAEEAFQETFLRIIKSIDDYKPTARFTTWLYTIARNYCIDQKRKGLFRQHLSLDEIQSNENYSKKANEIREEEKSNSFTNAQEIDAHLKRILDELNAEQKEVFILRQFQGLPFDQIAKVTGVSLNTVKSRMRYAMMTLQKKFRQLGITPD